MSNNKNIKKPNPNLTKQTEENQETTDSTSNQNVINNVPSDLSKCDLSYSDQNFDVYNMNEKIPYDDISKEALKNLENDVNHLFHLDDRKKITGYSILSLAVSLSVTAIAARQFFKYFSNNKNTHSEKSVPEQLTLEEVKKLYGLPNLTVPSDDSTLPNNVYTVKDKDHNLLQIVNKISSGLGIVFGVINSAYGIYSLYHQINDKDIGWRNLKKFKATKDTTYCISKPRYILDKKTNEIITIETNSEYSERIKNFMNK